MGPALRAQADFTFKVECLGYKFGAFGIVLYRKLRNRWRRTFIPLVWAATCTESKGAYALGFAELKRVLEAAGLPAPKVLGVDHFPGIEDAFRNEFELGRTITSMWHMHFNLSKHQGSGTSNRNKPRLKRFPLNRLKAYTAFTAVLPTRPLFAAAWRHTAHRLSKVYKERRWLKYFVRTYMQRVQLGGETCIAARWHYGARVGLPRGTVPFQQAVEQGHSQLKRGLGRIPRNADLSTVVRGIRDAVVPWCGEPQDDDERSGRLTAHRGNLAGSPDTPDAWMLEDFGPALYWPPLRNSVRVRGIPPFLLAARRDRSTWHTWTPPGEPQTTYHALGMLAPGTVPEGWIQDAVAQLKAKTVAQVGDLWNQLNILTPRGEDEPRRAPQEHFWFDKLKTFWTTAALIVCMKEPPVLRCHCFMSAAKGHCVHEYVIAELTGRNPLFGHIVPLARVGAAALRNRRAD